MSDYRHILLAVDFSEGTEQLVHRAEALRDCCAARLSLAHVVEYVPMAYAGDLALPDDFNLEQELMQVARQRMGDLGGRLGVPESDRHIALGAASREIVGIAQEAGADLVILGSHGRHGIAALLGSTANAVLHHAKCDILAVRIKL